MNIGFVPAGQMPYDARALRISNPYGIQNIESTPTCARIAGCFATCKMDDDTDCAGNSLRLDAKVDRIRIQYSYNQP